jgi:hypothetical protein
VNRATRNCPWSGELWGLKLRVLAGSEDYPFEELYALKQKAISIPWLAAQKTELAKMYFAWISICRAQITDWEDPTDEIVVLEGELEECLEEMGTGIPSALIKCF